MDSLVDEHRWGGSSRGRRRECDILKGRWLSAVNNASTRTDGRVGAVQTGRDAFGGRAVNAFRGCAPLHGPFVQTGNIKGYKSGN